MDVFTQGLIGATAAQSVARKADTTRATFIGFLTGMLADADVLIRSSTDPLLALEYHRHFTHSIFFVPVGALIAFLMFRPIFNNRIAHPYLYLYCFTGYSLSGLIDTCTSYGTYLFWPFINERIAWNIISIVDPVCSGILLMSISFCVYRKRRIFSRVGLILVSVYLLIGMVQHERAMRALNILAERRGHPIEQSVVKPTIGNIILWRSIYLSDDRFYVDAIRVGADMKIYQGDSIARYSIDKAAADIVPGSVLENDIKRFSVFSDGYVVQYPGKPNVLGDIRYSMNPVGINPLWGIATGLSDRHASYNSYRSVTEQTRQRFMDMLIGKAL